MKRSPRVLKALVLSLIMFFNFAAAPKIVSQDKKVILITGANRGIGKETALEFAHNGWFVYAGTRDVAKCPFSRKEWESRILCLRLNVTKEKDIKTSVAAIMKKSKRLDVLFNNAGIGVVGHEEEVTLKEARLQFDVNFFGPLRLIQEVLPHMRKVKSGMIINMSSTSGVRASAGHGIYGASKFALEGLSESLAQSLQHFGINIVLVESGPVKNDWFENVYLGSRNVHTEDGFYKKLKNYLVSNGKKKAEMGQDMKEIAKKVFEISQTKEPHLRYQTSQQVEEVIKLKLVDPTGDLLLREQIKNLEDQLKKEKASP